MRQFKNALGLFFAVMMFYLGTVFILKRFEVPDSPLRVEAKSIVGALRDYRASRGTYPVLPAQEGPLLDLKMELAKGGFLQPGDTEFSELDKEDRYVSDGTLSGLLFHVGKSPNHPTGMPCRFEFGPIWWPTG